MQKSKTRKEKQQLIENWQASGLTARKWCLQHHIPVSTFYGWRRNRISSKNLNEISFMELPEKGTAAEIRLEYKGVSILVPKNFNDKLLRACIQVIGGTLC